MYSYWMHRFKQNPLAVILPVASALWAIYTVYRLSYARTVLEAVKYGSFSIINAVRSSKK
jgi:hypothetical protein